MNAIYLVADTANGVQKIDPFDFPDAHWELNPWHAIKMLKRLEDGEELFFHVTERSPEHEKLLEEYGIN
jgi:hypothetical protein